MERIVAFLDILGSSHISKSGSSEEQQKILFLINRIHENYLSEFGVIVENIGPGRIIRHNLETASFSDNIVFSIPLDESVPEFERQVFGSNLLSLMISIFWQGLHLGVLFRGGVSVGECHHEGSKIFGKAITQAVEIEKETIYPRVEFSDEIFQNTISASYFDQYAVESGIYTHEGKHYLNTLNWHVGVWRDYFHFKYGDNQQPENAILLQEAREQIQNIEDMMEVKIKTLKDKPLEKWSWLYKEFIVRKLKWPLYA